MLGGLHRGDIAWQLTIHLTPILSRLSKQPPVIAVRGSFVLIPLRFHPLPHPLVDRWVAFTYLIRFQPKQVDHFYTTGFLGQVATVAVVTNYLLQPFHLA